MSGDGDYTFGAGSVADIDFGATLKWDDALDASSKLYTYDVSTYALLIKYKNDLLGRQSSERGRDEVTYFNVGDVFCMHLGNKYANFLEKIFPDISGRIFQTSSRSESIWHDLTR